MSSASAVSVRDGSLLVEQALGLVKRAGAGTAFAGGLRADVAPALAAHSKVLPLVRVRVGAGWPTAAMGENIPVGQRGLLARKQRQQATAFHLVFRQRRNPGDGGEGG